VGVEEEEGKGSREVEAWCGGGPLRAWRVARSVVGEGDGSLLLLNLSCFGAKKVEGGEGEESEGRRLGGDPCLFELQQEHSELI